MPSVILAAVGKLRESSWISAQKDYVERIRRYIRLELNEVKDALGRGVTDEKAVLLESERLLEVTGSARRRVALTPAGKEYDSIQFSGLLKKQIESYGEIAFLIGGPSGISREAIERCDLKLSLSPMTLPHELARIVLLEQLYRAFSILRGERYHR